jgi:hypothetical protein
MWTIIYVVVFVLFLFAICYANFSDEINTWLNDIFTEDDDE